MLFTSLTIHYSRSSANETAASPALALLEAKVSTPLLKTSKECSRTRVLTAKLQKCGVLANSSF